MTAPTNEQARTAVDPKLLERDSLLALLNTAMCCPSATHVLPSLCVLWEGAVRREDAGGRPATPDDLGGLIVWAHRTQNWLGPFEDFVPPPLESDVCVRIGNDCFRLHPATRTRTVGDLQRLVLVASTVDGTLWGKLGFRLSDYIELIMRHVDAVTERASACWTSSQPESTSAWPLLSEDEISAVMGTPSLESTAARCSNPKNTARALSWGTRSASSLAMKYPEREGYYGGLLRVVQGRGRIHDSPVALLIESLCEGAIRLTRIAVETDPLLDEKFVDSVCSRAGNLLRRLDARVLFGLRLSTGERVDALAVFGFRHYVALIISAGLDEAILNKKLSGGAERVMRVQPGSTLRDHDHEIRVPPDAEVVHLLVACGTDALQVRGPGALGVTLDDLECMLSGSIDEQSDLFFFLRDLRDMQDGASLGMTEVLDVWRAWVQAGKTLRNLQGFHMLSFSSYAAVDWGEAAARSSLERALAALGLPAARFHWPVKSNSDVTTQLQSPDGSTLYYLLHGESTCAIELNISATPATDLGHADGLASGLLWVIQRLDDVLAGIQQAAPQTSPLRIVLAFDDEVGSSGVELGSVNDGRVEMRWSTRLWEVAHEDPGAARTAVGDILVRGLGALHPGGLAAIEPLEQKWANAPPFFMAWSFEHPHEYTPDGTALRPHPASQGEAMASAVRALREAGVTEGDYRGRDAARIDIDHVYPALLRFFRQRVDALDGKNLVACAATELERHTFERWKRERQRRSNLAFPILAYDPVEKSMEEQQEEIIRSRALRLVIEEVLADPPSGARRPDVIEWREILGVAELLLDSSLRAETLTYGLAQDVLRFREHFGLEVVEGDDERILLADYRAAQTDFALHSGKTPDTTDEQIEEDAGQLPWEGAAFADVRQRFHDQFGCGLPLMMRVLAVLREWPASESDFGLEATREEVVEFYLRADVGEAPEVATAIDLLTLRGSDLRDAAREHWEQERRRVRLVTRPIIKLPDGHLLISPWHIGSSFGVYANYLVDCRLPWPVEILSDDVRVALDRLRQQRNQRLEDLVESRLKQLGLSTRVRIKKAKVLGLGTGHLPCGEIDVLAADGDERIVWVVEAKDPGQHFSPMQLHRSVEQFHGEKGYVSKLLKKVKVITDGLSKVLEAIDLDSSGEWRVEPLMVTRQPEVAAHVVDLRVPFATLRDLHETVGRYEDH